jgi:hypothetical protein
MKKISNLDSEIMDFLGEPINLGTPAEPMHVNVKKVLVNHIGSIKPKDGEEAIRAYSIGLKIAQSNGSVALEDADFKLLEKSLEDMKYSSLVMGQVFMVLKDAKTVLVEGAPEPSV